MVKKKVCISPVWLVDGPAGPRTLKNSVDYCTRCNACVQSCPSYLLRREEAFSPRGRNQLIRLLLERKIKPQDNAVLLNQVFSSCLLCTRCTSACAGALPVAQHVLALRRATDKHMLPAGVKSLLRLYGTHPALFDAIVRLLRLLGKAGLLRLLCLLGLCRLPALRWIKHADDILPKNGKTLQHLLKKQHILSAAEPEALYLPSLEAQYADGQIGLLTLRLLADKKTQIWLGQACGLFEYAYGEQSLCLLQAKRLLTRWESASKRRSLPLLTDSLEVYLFLKHYPVLFASLPGWRKRAEKLAARVKYVTDYSFTFSSKKELPARSTALDASSWLYPPGPLTERARKIIKTHLGKNFVECEYSRFVVAVGGSAFTGSGPEQQTTFENVKDVARRQLRQVFCLSGWAALELDAALRRHYPQARARHIVYLQTEP